MNHEYKYIAFISYKREDEKWAKWLQYKLEHYKLPTSARKANPLLPERASPVFKDTTDLAGGVLEKTIKEALNSSKYLIVICSPRAAQSPWVCKEVQEFIDSGKEEYIIPFIIDGVPNSLDVKMESFPQNLKDLSGSRELLGININEMGRDAAAIKVVAHMFQLQFNQLWQRWERERRIRRRWIIGLLLLGIITASVVIGVMFYQYKSMQINQARAVAHRAMLLAQDGDSYLARKLLLEVLPDEDDFITRPYVAEAEAALRYVNNYSSAIFDAKSGAAMNAKFSPDGKQVISTYVDDTIRIWDTKSGNCIRVTKVEVHEDTMFEICPNGKYIASYRYYDGLALKNNEMSSTIQLWDVNSGYCIQTFEGHTDWVDSVVFSPDGEYLVSASKDRTIRIWKVGTGECIRIIPETWAVQERTFGYFSLGNISEMVTTTQDRLVVISSNGKFIAAPCHNKENEVRVYSMDDESVEIVIGGVPSTISEMALSGDGRYLLTYYDDWHSNKKVVILWDVNSGECIHNFESDYSVLDIVFSPDSRYFVSATYDKTIQLWDVESGKCLKEFTNHLGPVVDASFSSDGKLIVSASHDGTIRLWDIQPTEYTMRVDADHVTFNAAFSSDGKYIASVSIIPDDVLNELFQSGDYISGIKRLKSRIGLWSTDTGELIRVFDHQTSCRTAAFSPNGRHIVTSDFDNHIIIWDILSGDQLKVFDVNPDDPINVVYSPDSRYIIYADDNSDTIKMIDIEDGKCVKELSGHTDTIESIIYSPNKEYILSLSNDSTMRLWNIESGECIHVFEGHTDSITTAYFCHKGSKILSTSQDNTIRLWDIKTGKCIKIYEGHSASVNDLSLTANEKYFVSASSDETLRLWNLESGKCMSVLEGHSDTIFTVNFSPDGKYFVSASFDDTFRLWDLESRSCVYIHNHKEPIHSAFFSKDGKYIIFAPHDTGIHFWRFYSLQELIDITREQSADNPLTDKERKEYYLQ